MLPTPAQFDPDRAESLQSSQAHEGHASELASALLEERANHLALCPRFVVQDHWRNAHDAIAVMNLYPGEDHSQKLLDALALPWSPAISEEGLHDYHRHVGLFDTYPGPPGDNHPENLTITRR